MFWVYINSRKIIAIMIHSKSNRNKSSRSNYMEMLLQHYLNLPWWGDFYGTRLIHTPRGKGPPLHIQWLFPLWPKPKRPVTFFKLDKIVSQRNKLLWTYFYKSRESLKWSKFDPKLKQILLPHKIYSLCNVCPSCQTHTYINRPLNLNLLYVCNKASQLYP